MLLDKVIFDSKYNGNQIKSITERYTAILFLPLQGMTGGGGSPLSGTT